MPRDKFKYLPIDRTAFLADNKVTLMSLEEVGAYFLLLLHAWDADPPCSIPNDDKLIARILNRPQEEWLRIKENVLAPWHINDPETRLYQQRLLREYHRLNFERGYQASVRERQRAGGLKGATIRFGDTSAAAYGRAEGDLYRNLSWPETISGIQPFCPGCGLNKMLLPALIEPRNGESVENIQPLCAACIDSKKFKGEDLRKKLLPMKDSLRLLYDSASGEFEGDPLGDLQTPQISLSYSRDKLDLQNTTYDNTLSRDSTSLKEASNDTTDSISSKKDAHVHVRDDSNEFKLTPPDDDLAVRRGSMLRSNPQRKLITSWAAELFEFWKLELNHPQSLFGKDRRAKVEARLMEGYTREQIKEAIKGMKIDRQANPERQAYDDIELICRHSSNLERFINIYRLSTTSELPAVRHSRGSYNELIQRKQAEIDALPNAGTAGGDEESPGTKAVLGSSGRNPPPPKPAGIALQLEPGDE